MLVRIQSRCPIPECGSLADHLPWEQAKEGSIPSVPTNSAAMLMWMSTGPISRRQLVRIQRQRPHTRGYHHSEKRRCQRSSDGCDPHCPPQHTLAGGLGRRSSKPTTAVRLGPSVPNCLADWIGERLLNVRLCVRLAPRQPSKLIRAAGETSKRAVLRTL